MKYTHFIIAMLFMQVSNQGYSQTTFPLYPDNKIPNSIPGANTERRDTLRKKNEFIIEVSKPTLTAYLPTKENSSRTAVIICPGGGYTGLAISHEGHEVAIELSKMGIAAFVLKYRVPSDKTMVNKEIGPLQDAQRAVMVVRERAAEWNIDTSKVGILGFSAGGHLASTAGTHFNLPVIENSKKISLRPDFMILIYPVISFAQNITHTGSRTNLLGSVPASEKIKLYSNELQVTGKTPQTFIVHAQDDKTVPIENSMLFFQALIQNKVSAEAHFYSKGGHGFGLKNKTTPDEWLNRCRNWLISNKYLNTQSDK